MKREEIISMAKEAFASRRAVDAWFDDAAPNFEKFAALVAAHEREEITKLIERVREDYVQASMNTKACAADYLIELIRARGAA